MKLGYSFNKSDVIVALQHLRLIMQASANCYAISRNSETNILNLYRFLHSDDNIEVFELQSNDTINDLYKPKKINYQWLLSGSLPFLTKASNKQSITIFSEAEKHILCLRIFNSETDSNDLLFIDFKNDPGIFSTALFSKSSEIQYKDLLAEFISTSVNAVIYQAKQERVTFQKLTAHVARMLELSQENKELAEKEKELHKQSVENLIKEYVNKLSLQYNRKFIISDTALSLLWEHRDSMFAIQDMVEDAIIFSLSQFPSEASNIVLHEEYFTIPNKTTTEHISYSPEIKSDISRSQKNEQFLYRLKASVELAISKKLSPTGKNIGRLCDPPITAPGISEYLSKYNVSIANIIFQNQERWAILTENFKPIQNLMANSNMRLKKAN